MLANERRVAASTHRQALSALLFLYREVLGIDMPWLQELGRPIAKKRIPVVLTQLEVHALLAKMGEGVTGLLARLLYGTGMRLLEGIRLRVKDVDFVRQVIVRARRQGRQGPRRHAAARPRRPTARPAAARASPLAPRPGRRPAGRLPAACAVGQISPRCRELDVVLDLPRRWPEQ